MSEYFNRRREDPGVHEEPDRQLPEEGDSPDSDFRDQNALWQTPERRSTSGRGEGDEPSEAPEEFEESVSDAGVDEEGRAEEAPVEEPPVRRGGSKDSYTIGEVVARLRQEFPSLSVSKVRYLERRKLINLTRTRGGYRLFSPRDIELLRHILTLQERDYLPLKVIKKKLESGEPIPRSSQEPGSEMEQILEERTYTRQEMADAIETDQRFVDELATVGVIGRSGELTQRDVEIARLALEMARYSIQPRHLRGIMAAVDREAAMFKQVFNPELRSGDEQRMQEAVGKARHLASVDSRMKELMMAAIIETFAR